VAAQSRRPAGGLPPRARLLLQARADGPATAGRLDPRARPAAARPHVGLRDRRPRRAAGRVGPGRDQRPLPDGSPRRGAAGRLHRHARRRLDRRRLLDLRRHPQGRRQPGSPPQARLGAGLGCQRVGLGLADGPPHALQPRLRRPGRQAVERAQGVRVVGRAGAALDRTRSGETTTCRTRPSRKRAATSSRTCSPPTGSPSTTPPAA
jgi:hypothetical protein